MSLISYNGIDLFGAQPSPFVSKDVDYIQAGERWAQAETITLNGQLTGCSEADLLDARAGILSKLTDNFKTLGISGVGTFSGVRIQDISFEDSAYTNILPYSIPFLCYPSGSFSKFYGVLDPSDMLTYQENEDRTMDISRSITARGINTSDSYPGNAIDNAKAFVAAQTGISVSPFIIQSQSSDIKSYLVSSQETIDRITNSVSVTQQFRTDLDAADGSVVSRYSVGISEQLGEFPVVNYQGQIDAGRYGSLSDCYSRYSDIKNSISNASYFFDTSVTEDSYINRLNFSFSFFSGEGAADIPTVEDDFSITVSETSDSSLFQCSIGGSVKLAHGCVIEDVDEIQNEFSQISNFNFNFCNDIYQEFYSTARGSKQSRPTNVALNTDPLSSSYSIASTTSPQIEYSAEFNDRFVPPQFLPAKTFEESFSITPPLSAKQISEHFKGGRYTCNSLGYLSRQRIGISLVAGGDVSSVASELLSDYAESVYNRLGTNVRKRKTAESFSTSETELSKSYDAEFSDKNDTEFTI
jgi:hypothetical protein